jgi:hypothetical protein
VDSFGRTGLAWASMGLQAHSLDARARMPDERDQTWKALMMTWTTQPNPHLPNDLSRRGKRPIFELGIMLGGLGHGGEVPLI